MNQRRAKLAAAIALLFLLVYWYRLLLLGQIPFDGGMLRLFYPSWVVGKTLLKSGCLLWDPFRDMGMPFLANSVNQALYPVRFVSVFLNFLDYQRVFVIFHVLLMGFSSYLLFIRLMKNQVAGLLGTVAMTFNGFVLARVTTMIDFATLSWFPAILYAFAMRRWILMGVLLTLQWLGGFPPFFILTGVFLVVYAWGSDDAWSSFICLAKGYAVAAGLAAVQYMPFLELMGQSVRPLFLNPSATTVYSLHPIELLRPLLVPSFILNDLKPVSDSDPAVIGFYLGPVITALFLVGLFRGRKLEKTVGGLGIAVFILSLGRHIPFYADIPFITLFRFPGNWLFVGTSAAVIVAVRGLQSFGTPRVKKILLALIAVDLLLYAWPSHSSWGDLTFIEEARTRVRIVKDLPTEGRIFHSPSITRTVHRWKIIEKDHWLALYWFMVPSVSVSYGGHEVASMHSLTTRRNAEFVDRLNKAPTDSPLYDLARVEKIIAVRGEVPVDGPPLPDSGVVINNRDIKPRAFFEDCRSVSVVLDNPGKILIRANGPGRLIVSESYYPGWSCRINGSSVFVEQYEKTFLAVTLPKGECAVKFQFRPLLFFIGATISFLTGLILLLLLIRKKSTEKRSVYQNAE